MPIFLLNQIFTLSRISETFTLTRKNMKKLFPPRRDSAVLVSRLYTSDVKNKKKFPAPSRIEHPLPTRLLHQFFPDKKWKIVSINSRFETQVVGLKCTSTAVGSEWWLGSATGFRAKGAWTWYFEWNSCETGSAPGFRFMTRLTLNTPKTNCELTNKSGRLLVEPRRRSCSNLYNSLLPPRARVFTDSHWHIQKLKSSLRVFPKSQINLWSEENIPRNFLDDMWSLLRIGQMRELGAILLLRTILSLNAAVHRRPSTHTSNDLLSLVYHTRAIIYSLDARLYVTKYTQMVFFVGDVVSIFADFSVPVYPFGKGR